MGGVLAATTSIIKSTMVLDPFASVMTTAAFHKEPTGLPMVFNEAIPAGLIEKPGACIHAEFPLATCAGVASAYVKAEPSGSKAGIEKLAAAKPVDTFIMGATVDTGLPVLPAIKLTIVRELKSIS